MMACNLSWNNQQDLLHIVTLLNQNEVVVGTSDTIIGLLANSSFQGYKKLNAIKKRFEKPYIVLVPDHATLKQLVKLPMRKDLEEIIKKFWPGPLTIIFNADDKVPDYLAPGGKIAIRMPNHAGLLEVLKQTGPLFSTSANITGQPVPKTIDEIDEDILEKVAAVIDGAFESFDKLRTSAQEKILPSTILDATREQLRIVREGEISVEKLKLLLK